VDDVVLGHKADAAALVSAQFAKRLSLHANLSPTQRLQTGEAA